MKYLPTSSELALATELSYAAELGAQGLTVDAVIDGTWSPVEETTDGGFSAVDQLNKELQETPKGD
jgi:hypothetical protein